MKIQIIALTILSLCLAASSAAAQTGGSYAITQSVIAAGGGQNSAGGTFAVDGIIGQAIAGQPTSGAPYAINAGFWTPPNFAPTAAGVSISGRVLTNNNRGLMNARVIITDSKGQNWTVTTSAFGNFRFDGALTAGDTVIVNVQSKRYIFAPQVISLTSDITGLTLTAQ